MVIPAYEGYDTMKETSADSASALHLASAGDVPFYTLDMTFYRKAIREKIVPAIEIVRT